MFFALGGSAIAAGGLIRAGDIARDAVTSRAIKGGAIWPSDLNAKTQESLQGADGATGAKGNTGLTGTAGTNGANGANGANGPNGANGANGANGVDGSDGTNGSAGTNGTAGTAGIDGIDGTNGIDGTDGIDGTIAPLWTTNGLTALPTATPPTVVVTMPVPAAGTYVVLAKTQLSHTGAGDSIDCQLKAGSTTIDQVSMKTLPALAAIPVSLQAVTTTTSPSQLSVECDVLTANGSANFSSLIAIPTG